MAHEAEGQDEHRHLLGQMPSFFWRLVPYRIAERLVAMSMWTLIAFALSKGTQLVVLLLLARILQPMDYGRLTLTQGLVAIFELFITLGAGPFLSKHIPEMLCVSVERCIQVINLCVLVFVSACVAVSIIAWLFSDLLASALFSSSATEVLFTTLAWAAFSGTNNFITSILVALERGRPLGTLSFLGALLSLLVVPFLGIKYGVFGAIVGLASVEAGKFFVSCSLYLKTLGTLGGRWSARPLRKDFRLLVSFGLPVFLASAIYSPSTWAAQLIVKFSSPLGISAVGVFGFTNNVFGAMMLVSTLTNQAALPIFSSLHAHGDHHQLRRTSLALSGVQLLAAMLIAIPLIGFSKFIMARAGPAFAPEWPTLVVMVITGVIMAGQTSLGNYLLVRERGAYFLLATLVPWCPILLGTAALLSDWGSMGLALAMLFATSARTTMVAWRWITIREGHRVI